MCVSVWYLVYAIVFCHKNEFHSYCVYAWLSCTVLTVHCSASHRIASYRIVSHWYRTEYKFNHKVCLRVRIYIFIFEITFGERKSKSSRAEQQHNDDEGLRKEFKLEKNARFCVHDPRLWKSLWSVVPGLKGGDCRQQAAKNQRNARATVKVTQKMTIPIMIMNSHCKYKHRATD